MLIGGIDEAGRGSVLGPLVVAGISIKNENIAKLHDLGVKDSKEVPARKRFDLFDKIIDIAELTCIYKLNCKTIDNHVYNNKLNKLEAKTMANIINNLIVKEVYIDSCDVNSLRYKEVVKKNVIQKNVKIYSMHKADKNNPVVSAASIIAKVIRDREIKKIRERFDNIGSGYPSDEITTNFIKQWVSLYNEPPRFARRSWKTVKNILNRQSSIYEFVD
ncbi:MAG: ribonuclease HII [Nitrososphaeraceae archaeon]